MPIWWNKSENYIHCAAEIIFSYNRFSFTAIVCLAFLTNLVHCQKFRQDLWRPPWKGYSQPISSSFTNADTQNTTVNEPMTYSALGSRHHSRARSRNRVEGRDRNRGRKIKERRAKWRGLLRSLEESIELIESKYIPRQVDNSKEDQMIDDRFGDCSLYPNNTFNSPFAFACETRDERDGIAPPAIVVHEAAFSDATGDYVYPLDFTQTLRIFLDFTSYATRRYDNLRTEITAYRRKVGWLGCGWSYVPTFGTLDIVEICDENNPSCPVYPGRQVFELKMASGPMTTRPFRLLHDDRASIPYQLRLRVFNNRGRGEELFCVMFQARINV